MMRQFSGRPYGWKEKLICFLLRCAFKFNSNKRGWQLLAVARKPAV